MSTETPNERRTRLIEQYVPIYLSKECVGTHQDIILIQAETMADTVIAATPQGQRQEPCQEPATRYPSEIETRLIELVDAMREELFAAHEEAALMFDPKIACIKFDLAQI